MERFTQKKRFTFYNSNEETTTIDVSGYTIITDRNSKTQKYHEYLIGEAVEKLAAYEDAEEQGGNNMDLDIVIKLMNCFPGSKINQYGEFIAHEKGNAYFGLKKCKSELDIKCKVLEWLSREAYKAQPFRRKDKNEAYHRFILGGINKYLNTKFAHDDMISIYCELGNAVNHDLTIKFIESGFDMSILENRQQIQEGE